MVKSSPTLALGVLFGLCLVSAQNPSGFDFESTCTSLASTLSRSISNATVFFSSLVPAGSSITFPDTDSKLPSTWFKSNRPSGYVSCNDGRFYI
ncbi:hypothetical protein VKT23_011129 [Stygiomarasmius scandens]|uniref:Uncharacterized protein n=1 Tax=Marasmiellus scandens TaxID=2682957 RepID=A0ABR1JCG7_9AGAR